MSKSEHAPAEKVDPIESLPRAEPLPESDASAIPVDQDSPLTAAGPLEETPEDFEESVAQQEPLIPTIPLQQRFLILTIRWSRARRCSSSPRVCIGAASFRQESS